MDLKNVLTATELAKLLGVSDRTIRRRCESGLYVARRTDKNWIILKDSVKELKEGD